MKSKIVAIAIFLFLFLVPFRMLFITDEIVQGQKFILLLLVNVIGFFIAFGIGTNEPFDRKEEETTEAEESQDMRKAA